MGNLNFVSSSNRLNYEIDQEPQAKYSGYYECLYTAKKPTNNSSHTSSRSLVSIFVHESSPGNQNTTKLVQQGITVKKNTPTSKKKVYLGK